jgi:hypothetical protein
MTSDRNEFVELVMQLHSAVGYVHPVQPSLLSDERRDLWVRLLKEEVAELSAALSQKDLVAVADALGDCLYVIVGASLAFGIPIEEVFREIHRSNMTKDVIASSSASDGTMEVKLQKGKRYVAPDLKTLFDRGGL